MLACEDMKAAAEEEAAARAQARLRANRPRRAWEAQVAETEQPILTRAALQTIIRPRAHAIAAGLLARAPDAFDMLPAAISGRNQATGLLAVAPFGSASVSAAAGGTAGDAETSNPFGLEPPLPSFAEMQPPPLLYEKPEPLNSYSYSVDVRFTVPGHR
jgi:hypothetical protein